MERCCEYSIEEFVFLLVTRGICRCKGKANYVAEQIGKDTFCEDDFVEAYRLDAMMFDEYDKYDWKKHYSEDDC